MKEEDRCWCGSLLKDKPHNCIGTKDRVMGLLTEVRLLRDAIDKSNVALEEAVMMKEERDSLKLQVDELKAELKKAHDGHGYRNGLGPCVCKWCVEKPAEPPPHDYSKWPDPKTCELCRLRIVGHKHTSPTEKPSGTKA
ncbi:MAG: hypothetical protein MUO75_04970 [Actinobacteria bacterium]|nr:hypothetical protein [Actinomycetota bacterium]